MPNKPNVKFDAIRNFDSLPDSAIVRAKTVAALRGCHEKTVWKHVEKGLLPRPEKISSRISGWRVGVIRALIGGASI